MGRSFGSVFLSVRSGKGGEEVRPFAFCGVLRLSEERYEGRGAEGVLSVIRLFM